MSIYKQNLKAEIIQKKGRDVLCIDITDEEVLVRSLLHRLNPAFDKMNSYNPEIEYPECPTIENKSDSRVKSELWTMLEEWACKKGIVDEI